MAKQKLEIEIVLKKGKAFEEFIGVGEDLQELRDMASEANDYEAGMVANRIWSKLISWLALSQKGAEDATD